MMTRGSEINGAEMRRRGDAGEDTAVEFLEYHGYTVIARNYYSGHCEIDIIAVDPAGETVVFCEVKTRDAGVAERYGRPASAVGYTKRKNLKYAADGYIKKHPRECAERRVRIDVIEVYLTDGAPRVRHIKNAVIS